MILKQEAGLVPGLAGVEAVDKEAAVPAAGGQEAAVTGEGEVSDAPRVGRLLPPQPLGHLVTQPVILTRGHDQMSDTFTLTYLDARVYSRCTLLSKFVSNSFMMPFLIQDDVPGLGL